MKKLMALIFVNVSYLTCVIAMEVKRTVEVKVSIDAKAARRIAQILATIPIQLEESFDKGESPESFSHATEKERRRGIN